MIIIEDVPIELSIRAKDTYPQVRDSLDRMGIKVRNRSIQSDNYSPATAGWIIRANGTIEALSIIAGSYITTFVQDATPTSLHIGDLWIKTNDNNRIYRAESVGADAITGGEWVDYGTLANWSEVVDDDANKPDDNADVTGNNTSDDTAHVNISDAALVQKRAEVPWTKGTIMVFENDGATFGGFFTSRNPLLSILGVSGADFQATYQTDIFGDWDVNAEMDLVIIGDANFAGETAEDVDGFLGLHSEALTIPTVKRHIGFFFDNGVIYATNGNNTTQTKTDISGGLDITEWSRFRFVYTAGVDIKFYVDDVLKATHTTNLPSGASDKPAIHVRATGNDLDAGSLQFKHTPTCVVMDL